VPTLSELTSQTPPWTPPGGPGSKAPYSRLARTIWERSQIANLAYGGFVALGVRLARAGVSANALTYASLLVGVSAGLFAAIGNFWLAAAAVFAGGVLDALDGIVARTTGTVTPFGALLDSTIDRVTDAVPLLGILYFFSASPLLAAAPAVALVGSIVIPYARARAEGLGAQLPPLFMRRPERVVLLVASFLLANVDFDPFPPAPLLWLGMVVLGVLNAAGAVSVLLAARRALTTPSSTLG